MYFVILMQFESSIHKYDNINIQFDKFFENFTRIVEGRINGSESY